jgi:hypothetical protein
VDSTPSLFGSLFKADEKFVGSRLLVVNSIDLTEETLAEMTEYHKELTEAFAKLGGVPDMAMTFGIFGQFYEGLDVLAAIVKSDNSIVTITITEVKIVQN